MDISNFHYHCSAEWHLARLSPASRVVYPHALRLSRKSGKFCGSAVGLAEYFAYERHAIGRSLRELVETGFFVLLEKGTFESNIYKVLPHTEWAAANPGRCTSKVEMPWAGEGDPLGQQLWIASGSRIKFRDDQVQFLRKLGLSEPEIVSQFEKFWVLENAKVKASIYKSNRRGIVRRFLTIMGQMRCARAEMPGRLPTPSGVVR
jgi:hypothetical protein